MAKRKRQEKQEREAAHITAALDTLRALWSSNSEAARDSAFHTATLRSVADELGVPYLAVLLQREAQVNEPSFALEDLDELLDNPVALAVCRRRWPAETEAA